MTESYDERNHFLVYQKNRNLSLWVRALIKAKQDAENKRNERLREATIRWFNSKETHIGSFIWITGWLGVEPSKIKKGMKIK